MIKTSSAVAVLALGLSAISLSTANAQGTARIVDDDGRASSVSCDAANPAPSSIQAAINAAASGETILVCPGFYPEQLKVVAKNLTIRGVKSGDQNLVLIRPQAMVVNSTNAYSGGPIAAVIAIEGSTSVVLRNITIDGDDNLLTGCTPTLVGVFYRNSSGRVESATVRNIRLGAELQNCQSGFGVFAQSGTAGIAKVTVSDSSIHDYQKVGILANEAGTELQALTNAITGGGPETAIAQNGIQIGFGAGGDISNNSIVNHVRACLTFGCDSATNILVFESNAITITGNHTAKSEFGIYLVRSNDSRVRSNTVSDTDIFDGIAVVGNGNRVRLNSVSNTDEYGVYVAGNNNRIDANRINDAPCGIFAQGTGNDLAGNFFFNTELATCEPFTLSLQGMSLTSKALSSSSGAAAAGSKLGDTPRRDAVAVR